MASPELIEKAKVALADTFVMYMKAHAYHWNIIGSDFPQLHGFFGSLYEELHGAIDDLAESLRTLESFAPGSLARMAELATIKEDTQIPTPTNMINNLIEANEALMKSLTDAYEKAENEKVFAYSNFIQDRLTAHAKHGWMLKSIKGKE
jgi:starvation-inducible DNA-binding protein